MTCRLTADALLYYALGKWAFAAVRIVVANGNQVDDKEATRIVSLSVKCMLAVAAVVLVNLLLLIVFGDNGLVELSRLRDREQTLADQNELLARENVNLYRTIGRLRQDPLYLESVARNELGMIGKDDIIIIQSDDRPPGKKNG